MSKQKHKEDEETIGDPPAEDFAYTDEEIRDFVSEDEEEDDIPRDDPSGDLGL
jgi:hypothetical protein